MSTTAIPRHVEIWTRVITETLTTGLRAPYSKLRSQDLQWGFENWLREYENLKLNPDVLYTGLVLANRESAVGKFAIIFNTYLYEAIEFRDVSKLKKALHQVPFPELFDNPRLSKSNLDRLKQTLKHEKLSLNLTIEKILTATMIPDAILNTPIHTQSYKDVCIRGLGGQVGSLENLCFHETSERSLIYVSDTDTSVGNIHVWCFNLLQLVALITLKQTNPYTNNPFTDRVTQVLRNKYFIEIQMYQQAIDIITSASKPQKDAPSTTH
jgi:hypothetical protein